MLKNENIICISSIDWDFVWQGHQEIMSALAENGNKVLFIENTGVRTPGVRDIPRIRSRIKNWFKGIKGIRKERDNLYIFSPLVLPFPYSKIARLFNRHSLLSVLERWMAVMDFTNPIVWTFLPTPLSMDIMDNMIKKLVVYYCIDNFSASSAAAKKIKRSEKRLLKKADIVFATSRELYNNCAKCNSNVHSFPFGVNFNRFQNPGPGYVNADTAITEIKRPIIGYIGGVHKWIDQQLIRELAKESPDHSFVFIGPIQTDISQLSLLKNVHFLGSKDHRSLPHFISQFDVGIIPYQITEYTKNVYPTKLNEYLAAGKPVVSTPIPEVLEFNKRHNDIVYIGGDKESFGGAIKRVFLNTQDDDAWVSSRIAVAKENSWQNRIEQMSALITRQIEAKKSDIEAKWKENLLVFYRKAKRRTLMLCAGFFLAYFLLFKTPFIWFVASPLKITDTPQKADAIVVFGGGVGETGSPGKSTIERARYASELYSKGYADEIIFSSGYMYAHNDAENMKLIALSEGVPEKNIILEQKGNNTYQNVIFCAKILDERAWRSILLVSSPYNMRRAALVFNKKAKGKKVLYTPVIRCQFYDPKKGSRLTQISAIIHEYAGIAYYWWKGYI